jgi:hypothetical protein
MKKLFSLLFIGAAIYLPVSAQKLDKVKFFQEESIVNATLEMDLKDLLAKKAKERYLPGTMTLTFKDGSTVSTKITATVRGQFQKGNLLYAGTHRKFQGLTQIPACPSSNQ